MIQIRSARDLRPGHVIWVDEQRRVPVVAALPTAGGLVTIFTGPSGELGRITAAPEDGYRVVSADPASDMTRAVTDCVLGWHVTRDARCCAVTGPFCVASIVFAFQQLRRVDVLRSRITRSSHDSCA